jgi:hypothetical protein
MMRRIARRLRALWHRRELRWVLAELGLADLDQLAACLATPRAGGGGRQVSRRRVAGSSERAPPRGGAFSREGIKTTFSDELVLHRLRGPAGDETGARLG